LNVPERRMTGGGPAVCPEGNFSATIKGGKNGQATRSRKKGGQVEAKKQRGGGKSGGTDRVKPSLRRTAQIA